MNTFFNSCFLPACLLLFSCTNRQAPKQQSSAPKEGTFAYDLQFLQKHDSVLVLKSEGEAAQVIVSPGYQGKVFTSTAEGNGGKSFGWINYKAFTAAADPHMNAYGGENRLWLGPEGGPFSLFFTKGAEMTFEHWKTPAAFDTEAWAIKSKDATSVQLQKNMALANYAGTPFQLSIDRTISILDRKAIETQVQFAFDSSVKAVGYKTTNTLTNTGKKEWDEKTGAPCIWMLDMFNPSPQTTIVIPYEENKSAGQKVATTNYFGEISQDRIKYASGVLFFKADGKSRGKLGITPLRAKPVAASYDALSNVLTIAFFDVVKGGKYLNQEWTTSKPPYSGDAVNAYNDGPLKDGTQLGPFYEIESVSPAAFLKPGASMTHQHSVFHFIGNKTVLDQLTRKLLGVSLADIQKAL